jgi:hypothetical protein
VDFPSAWKASSIVLTGAFGILGLLRDFKDKQTGKVTRWGYVSLAGILISTCLGVAAQLKEDLDDSAKSLALARKSDATLNDIQKLLSPFDVQSAQLIFTVQCSDKFYRKLCASVRNDEWLRLSKLDPIYGSVLYRAHVPLYRKNALANKTEDEMVTTNPDVFLGMEYIFKKNDEYNNRPLIRHDKKADCLEVILFMKARVIAKNGGIKSTLEFKGTTAMLTQNAGLPRITIDVFRLSTTSGDFESVKGSCQKRYWNGDDAVSCVF